MAKHGHNKTTKNKTSWNVKESKLRPETNAQGRVDLDPFAFEALIQQKGVNVKVSRSLYCPNVKSVDGAEHNIDCQLCNGSGFIDVDPICTKAVIQNQNLESIAKIEGNVDGNHVAITFPIGIELQYFTLVELTDFTEIYYQRVMRNPDSTTDVLKYRACRVNVVIDSNGVKYYQDQDFQLDVNGNILWSGTRVPADNSIYSIHYEAHVQFRAVSAMHVNRFSQYKPKGENGQVEHLKFQEQWMCVKEFLVRRRDLAGNDLDQGPYDNHEIVVDEQDQ